MNSVILIGNLTRDPKTAKTSNNTVKCDFTIAVNVGENTSYIPVVAWRKNAENCGQYLKKGNKVAVRGSLQIRNYTNTEGDTKTIAEVVADSVEFLTPKSETTEAK